MVNISDAPNSFDKLQCSSYTTELFSAVLHKDVTIKDTIAKLHFHSDTQKIRHEEKTNCKRQNIVRYSPITKPDLWYHKLYKNDRKEYALLLIQCLF